MLLSETVSAMPAARPTHARYSRSILSRDSFLNLSSSRIFCIYIHNQMVTVPIFGVEALDAAGFNRTGIGMNLDCSRRVKEGQ